MICVVRGNRKDESAGVGEGADGEVLLGGVLGEGVGAADAGEDVWFGFEEDEVEVAVVGGEDAVGFIAVAGLDGEDFDGFDSIELEGFFDGFDSHDLLSCRKVKRVICMAISRADMIITGMRRNTGSINEANILASPVGLVKTCSSHKTSSVMALIIPSESATPTNMRQYFAVLVLSVFFILFRVAKYTTSKIRSMTEKTASKRLSSLAGRTPKKYITRACVINAVSTKKEVLNLLGGFMVASF